MYLCVCVCMHAYIYIWVQKDDPTGLGQSLLGSIHNLQDCPEVIIRDKKDYGDF